MFNIQLSDKRVQTLSGVILTPQVTNIYENRQTHFELVESLSQSLDCLHVQVIGRLVQDVEVWTEGQTDRQTVSHHHHHKH